MHAGDNEKQCSLLDGLTQVNHPCLTFLAGIITQGRPAKHQVVGAWSTGRAGRWRGLPTFFSVKGGGVGGDLGLGQIRRLAKEPVEAKPKQQATKRMKGAT